MARTCCEEYNDLGCVGFCDEIETGLTATATGVHKISLVPGGGYYEQTFTIGSAINFDNVFNENAVSVFTVTNPSGDLMELNAKDCFKIEIKAALSLA